MTNKTTNKAYVRRVVLSYGMEAQMIGLVRNYLSEIKKVPADKHRDALAKMADYTGYTEKDRIALLDYVKQSMALPSDVSLTHFTQKLRACIGVQNTGSVKKDAFRMEVFNNWGKTTQTDLFGDDVQRKRTYKFTSKKKGSIFKCVLSPEVETQVITGIRSFLALNTSIPVDSHRETLLSLVNEKKVKRGNRLTKLHVELFNHIRDSIDVGDKFRMVTMDRLIRSCLGQGSKERKAAGRVDTFNRWEQAYVAGQDAAKSTLILISDTPKRKPSRPRKIDVTASTQKRKPGRPAKVRPMAGPVVIPEHTKAEAKSDVKSVVGSNLAIMYDDLTRKLGFSHEEAMQRIALA